MEKAVFELYQQLLQATCCAMCTQHKTTNWSFYFKHKTTNWSFYLYANNQEHVSYTGTFSLVTQTRGVN